MGATAHALRYPDPTDAVTNGALAIQNLATDVESALYGGGADIYPRSFTVRPAATQVGGTVQAAVGQSSRLSQWLDSSGSGLLAEVNPTGRIGAYRGLAVLGIDGGTGVGLYVSHTGPGNIQELIQGANGQTANLTEWRAFGSSSALAKMDSGGGFWAGGLHIGDQSWSAPGIYAGIGAASATAIPLGIKGATGHSTNLTSWLAPDGTTPLLAVMSDGKVSAKMGVLVGNGTASYGGLFSGNGAPTNAVGSQGSLYLRFDGNHATTTALYFRDAVGWTAIA